MSNLDNAHSGQPNSIKPNLKEIRENLQITQRQLSDKLGVTENTIANWENGRSIGKWLYQIKLLCQALDCSFEELTENENSPLSQDSETSFAALRKDYQDAIRDSENNRSDR
ncbi:helix-turn-helix transcriptional regulator [Oscillatoria sp. CS-180]|uniref:helix-turn-helix transcriptional regulator n=1 Tax=Oscillatoria sp. CS-180 TaxID=3021720 RepID=UPI0023312E99|nr:helix-turn-helix transcriptional regulator [Oscillatoria sp. CS-180]MDB9526657.1 helix-turn-helix transcriptional regulator [Oscillatoria sp. CS-180]